LSQLQLEHSTLFLGHSLLLLSCFGRVSNTINKVFIWLSGHSIWVQHHGSSCIGKTVYISMAWRKIYFLKIRLNRMVAWIHLITICYSIIGTEHWWHLSKVFSYWWNFIVNHVWHILEIINFNFITRIYFI